MNWRGGGVPQIFEGFGRPPSKWMQNISFDHRFA